MASFKKTREMIVIAYAEKLLTDEEFLFLYEVSKSVNLELPYYEYEEFNLENISEAECKAEFRFERGDIERLADVLQLPPTFECPQGSVCDRIEGLCILLRRLAYPCRYSDMVSRFARPVPVLCMISNIVLNYIYDLHHRRITAWNHAILNPLALRQYADAVSEKGAALNNCFGFVDGTIHRFVNQESIKGWYTMGTREFMLSSFRLLPSLMALLDNCLDLWVRIGNERFPL